jgi:predicted RNA-binding protein with TRAM domain
MATILEVHNVRKSYLIFVPNGKIGERVRVRIRSVGGKFAVTERMA